MIRCILFFFIGFFVYGANAQTQPELKNLLDSVSERIPALNSKVYITVSDVTLQEFLRSIGVTNDVSFDVSNELTTRVFSNFYDVPVKDVLIHLAEKYRLQITVTGQIIAVNPVKTIYPSKEIKAVFDSGSKSLSLDLKNDTLINVVRKISEISGMNIVLSPGLNFELVTSYLLSQPFETVMQQFAMANQLLFEKTGDNAYLIRRSTQDLNQAQQNYQSILRRKNKNNNSFDLKILPGDSIRINTANAQIREILDYLFDETQKSFMVLDELKGTVNLNIASVPFDKFLNILFEGTDIVYRKIGKIYLFGTAKNNGLFENQVVRLNYRAVEKIADIIPQDLKKDLLLTEFVEQNSLIISGPALKVYDLVDFIKIIDLSVPVILIEVMIVDYNETIGISSGIKAGFNEKSNEVGRSVFPNLDYSLNAGALNNIISSLNGFGFINLNKVTPNFYVHIKALEEQGILKIRSTPKLSTLNGHEASLSIGKTEYYREEQVNVYGMQSQNTATAFTYKDVKADLSVIIKPIVSGDDQITLNIEVKQSDFTGKILPTAPPGQVTRSFKSLIRVKNQDMILLGGLEQLKNNDTGAGVPLLSKIPILKWLFSSRSKDKSDSKLNIFIKPTIIN